MLVRELVPAPPVGFRRAIPTSVKLDVVIRQEGRCRACNQLLGVLKATQFDHVPALQLRVWDPIAEDTTPAANDADFIQAKHVECHAEKTTGRKGESKLNAIHGDVAEISKLKRLTRSEEEFRRRLLAKDQDEEEPDPDRPPQKRKWPKRPFPKRRKDGSGASRDQENDPELDA